MGLSLGDAVLLRTFKLESQLELWLKPAHSTQFVLFRTYPVCAFSGTLGPKLRVGDRQTPEGFYAIRPNALNPNSRFHLSMDIGYPNQFDKMHGRTGSLLMIHGSCDSIGCFAMGNQQIEEIYYLVSAAFTAGQAEVPVHAFPFHLRSSALEAQSANVNYDFWYQLKAGYDAFNQSKQIPVIKVVNGRYVVD